MFCRRNGSCAIFVRHFDHRRLGFGRRRFLGHVVVGIGSSAAYNTRGEYESVLERARQLGRSKWSLYFRSCDKVEAEHDGGRYAVFDRNHAPAPGGVGLL